MAVTLAESAKLSQDTLQRGVIEVMVRSSAVLELLPFMDIVGNAYGYNQVSTLPTVAFRDVNAGYVEASAGFDYKTDKLVMLGGDVDVDKFIAQTRGNLNDQRAVQTELKAKAVAQTYTSTFFYGNTSTTPLAFDGVVKRVASTAHETTVADTAGAITLADLNKLLDMIPYGADVIFMNRTVRRIVMNLLQASTHYIENGVDAFGKPVMLYGGVPVRIVEDDIMPAQGSAGVNGYDIVAVQFGAETGVCGLQNGGVTVTDIGELETMPVYRTRIEWYCGLAVFNPNMVAVLHGIKK